MWASGVPRDEICAQFPNRSRASILSMASLHKIRRNKLAPRKARFWTQDKVCALRELWQTESSLESIAQQIGTSKSAVVSKACLLELTRTRLVRGAAVKIVPSALLSEVDAAYIAGFVDGEGCISMRRDGGNGISVWLQITNTNSDVLLWIQQTVGFGNLFEQPVTGNRKRTFSLRLGGREKCAVLLKTILPYLKVKDEQARLAIHFVENLSNNRSPQAIAEARAMCERFKDLNWRGAPKGTTLKLLYARN